MGTTVLRCYRYERHPDNYQYVTHTQSEVLRNMRLIARSKSDVTTEFGKIIIDGGEDLFIKNTLVAY